MEFVRRFCNCMIWDMLKKLPQMYTFHIEMISR